MFEVFFGSLYSKRLLKEMLGDTWGKNLHTFLTCWVLKNTWNHHPAKVCNSSQTDPSPKSSNMFQPISVQTNSKAGMFWDGSLRVSRCARQAHFTAGHPQIPTTSCSPEARKDMKNRSGQLLSSYELILLCNVVYYIIDTCVCTM